MQETSPDPKSRSPGPPPAKAGTGTAEYASIAARKYAAAADRVASVHARFQRELDSMAEEIARQSALSKGALERFSPVGPGLEAMAKGIEAMGAGARSVGGFVREGRSVLKGSMSEVQEAIGRLRVRNEEMGGILDISRRVSESVAGISEIALENKLIAINASVTASKAGESVKGFKVIADEISRQSAAMEERAASIAGRAEQVGESMRRIMSAMDGSIASTSKALGIIDQAFALLDSIEAAVRETEAADAEMLEENARLLEKARTLGTALEGIDGNITKAAASVGEVNASMRAQAANVGAVAELLPRLRDIGRALADSPSPEGPKILRACELACSTYDPALTRMLREIHYVSFVGIRLLRYSSDKRLVPYLADTWFLHPDGTTWEFKLKRGVLFHDGSPVRSGDVKFTFERLLNPALGSPYAALFSIIDGAQDFIAGKARGVAGIQTPDEGTVVFRLKDPFNFFLSLLALSFSSILKEDRGAFSRPLARHEIVSAGPFRWAPGEDPGVDSLARNEGFVDGPPFLDGMEIKRDPGDVPAAICGGELDMAYNLPASSAADFKRLGFDGELRYYASRYCYGLVVNFSRRSAVARDAELRRAIAMSIDKDAIVRDALEGKAVRADAVLPPESLDLGGRVFVPYAPDEARRIVERARSSLDLSAPVKLAFRSYATIPSLPRIAGMIEKAFASLGLRVETSFHPAATPIASFKDGYDIVFLGFLSELDLYSALEPFINPEGGDNYFGYDNPGLFKELNDSRTIKDEGERMEFFRGILEKLTRDVFTVPLFFNKSILAASSRVRSIVLSAEESFYPDEVFLAENRTGGGPAAADSSLARRYDEAIRELGGGTRAVVDGAKKLIEGGREIGRLVHLQTEAIVEADAAFSSFSESAGKVQEARAGIVERIRGSLDEAARGGEATASVQAGLRELTVALEAATKALDRVRGDTRDMLEVVGDIGKSNEFISSVAVNAAIIAAKADARGGDLVKVSRSISEQARENTRISDETKAILEELAEVAADHLAFLDGLVGAMRAAAHEVGRSGAALGAIGPVLAEVDAGCSEVERVSVQLAESIREAEKSIYQISFGASELSRDAETLRFGLEMERAVSGLLSHAMELNEGVRGYLLRRS